MLCICQQILRTFQEGDRVWVGWPLDFNVRINRDILISLLKFEMKVHVWNCKEKLSNLARHERIKAFRLPKDHSGEVTDGISSADLSSHIDNPNTVYRMISQPNLNVHFQARLK